MKKISIEPTSTTPKIFLDKGILEIHGRSIMEDSDNFYKPIIEWLNNYKAAPSPSTVINIGLEYFNTASSKSFLNIFKKLEELRTISKVNINWYYTVNDEDMYEAGEDYKSIINLPFKLIKLDNEENKNNE